jgi:hypothetical protein
VFALLIVTAHARLLNMNMDTPTPEKVGEIKKWLSVIKEDFPQILAILVVAIPLIWMSINYLYKSALDAKDAQLATKDDQIKLLERQRDDFKDKTGTSTPDEAKAKIAAMTEKIQTVEKRLRTILPRILTDEQMTEMVNGIKPFAGQKVSIHTYDALSECMNIANRIRDVLHSANWEYQAGRPPSNGLDPFGSGRLPPIPNIFGIGRLPPIPMSGVLVNVEPKAEEKTKNAAKALVDALNHAQIDAKIGSYFLMKSAPADANGPHFVESPENATNIVMIQIGTKPD